MYGTFSSKDDGQGLVILEPEDETCMNTAKHMFRRQGHRMCNKKILKKRFPISKWLPLYNTETLVADLVAGLTVGLTLIPQGIAYAVIADVPPQYGLYSAFMGCFVYVIFGSTRAITIGPTAIMALMTHDQTSRFGPEAAILLCFLSGCITLILGLLNLGFLIDFIATPVIAGFTSAAAVTIATTQLKSLFGLKFSSQGFISDWSGLVHHLDETRLGDTLMGFAGIITLLLMRAMAQCKWQGPPTDNASRIVKVVNNIIWLLSTGRNAIIVVVCTVIAYCATDPDNIADGPFLLTGNITAGLPEFALPPFSVTRNNQTYNFFQITSHLGSSIIVTPLIGILESIAIAKAFAEGEKVDATQEMIAIGLSNVMGSFVSSFPVTGSFSRTAVNAACGVKTPLGGVVTGSLSLLALSVLTPYFSYIPKSCLSAVIITSVIFMIEVHVIKPMWRSNKIDIIPFFTTFFACVFWSLEYGILVGTCINLAILLYHSARPRINVHVVQTRITDYILVEPDRSLVFPSVDYFVAAVRKALLGFDNNLPVVVNCTYISQADYTTAMGLKHLAEGLEKENRLCVLINVRTKVHRILIGVRPNHIIHNGEDLESFFASRV